MSSPNDPVTTPARERPFRCLALETRTAIENMAIDEAILLARIENRVPSTLRFYRWNPSAASIGKHQSLHDEVDLAEAGRRGVDVVRRISGGGAVFHSFHDEITYSIVVKETEVRHLTDARNATAVSHALSEGLVLGVQKYGTRPAQGVIHCPALFLEGKKISGNAQARRRKTILQHGTLLLGVDPDLMYSILKVPRGATKSRMVRSVYAKVTGLRDHFPRIDEAELIASLLWGFSEALGVQFQPGALTPYEKDLAARLAREKYATEEWLAKYE